METLLRYYQQIISRNESDIRLLNRRMNLMGGLRLLLVAGWITVLILLNNPGVTNVVGITLGFAIPFVLFMVFHDRLSGRKKFAVSWNGLCYNELRGLIYDYSAFDGAADKIDPGHSFSFDIDLFGEESLFQSINRTVSHGGRELLADWFLSPLREKQAIRDRQEAILELGGKAELRHRFYVTGDLNRGSKSDAGLLESLARYPFAFARNRFWKILVWVVPAVWVLLAGGFFSGLINGAVPLLFFIVSVILALAKTKEVNALHRATDKMEKRLSAYSRLIGIIEAQDFDAVLLRNLQQRFLSGKGGMPASRIVKKLSGLLNALDQRGNLIIVILNIFILRDIRIAIRLERWKQIHQDDVPAWFDALSEFDGLCSLGTFAFNHPDYIYPELTDDYFTLKGKALGHPLMRRDACVRNDVSFTRNPSFMIVTGANMAGKSTYLRTIAVNYLLACTGAPVWAEELAVFPAGLVTSLRTSDSLTRNESYFFAELKRLKMIIDRLRSGEQLFILLDEILKGTNSTDKQKGSLALIRQFVSLKTGGIIATHDLVLGTLADEFPGVVRNYRFEGEIHTDKLVFTYRLQEGVAQNMNATFLMEKMGITV